MYWGMQRSKTLESAEKSVAKTLAEMRDGVRHTVNWGVEIAQNHQRIGFGQIMDISRSGVAFRCDTNLQLGGQYLLGIPGCGEVSCTILRCTDGLKYAGRFDLGRDGKLRLETHISQKVANETASRS